MDYLLGPSAVVLYERLPQLTHGRLLDEEQMRELRLGLLAVVHASSGPG